jgi:hypothetical protein
MPNGQSGPPPNHHVCVMKVLAENPWGDGYIPMPGPYYIRLWYNDPVQGWLPWETQGPFSNGQGYTFHIPVGNYTWKVDAVKSLYTDPPDPWQSVSDYMEGTGNVVGCTYTDGGLTFALAS